MGPRQNLVDGGYKVTNQTLYTKTGSLRPSDVEALTCGICSKILREPVQLITCGCRFCNVCIQKIVLSEDSCNETLSCSEDGEPFTRNDIRKDKGCMKEIQQLEVDCPALSPCGWRGSLARMEAHESEECPNTIISCTRGCGATFLRSLEADHLYECPKREVTCEHCSASVPQDGLQDHYTSCPEHPLTCDYCEEHIPHRREFTKHLEETCTECKLNCPMAKALGCSFMGKRSEMTQHTMNSHLMNVLEKVSELSISVITIKADNEDLRKQLKEKDKKIDKLEARVTQLESTQSSQHSLIDSDIERDGPKVACHRGIGGVGTLGSQGFSNSAVPKKPSPSSTRAIEPSGKAMTGLTHMLRENVDRHDNQISRLQESVQSLQQNLTQYSIAVDELRLRQDVQDVKTTHGVFIWKIPDIRRRYRDALDRKTISLYSPPFQTSPHGYRMCIRVYLNGDGAGKGTYISLFFVLMRSEHDDLLNFPFKQSVRFSLINQANQAESITEAFAPDLSSQSFQKPQGEMNVASGFPKFARQTVLHDERFTKGNVIYIKAKVDPTGLTAD